MSKMNQKASDAQKAPRRMTTFEKAERTLVTCLLSEDCFYEDGVSITDRLASYVPKLSEDACRKILNEAKVDNKLRHAPIFWAVQMAKEGKLKADDVEMVTDRVDLMADLLAEYWRENKRPDDEINERRENHKRVNKMVPKQMVKGLQSSFKKFDEYQLSKYLGSKNEVKLRDVLKVVRPKPENDKQAALWGKVLKDELKMDENTWEVAISACGKDIDKKKAEWTRLLTEKTDKGYNKLGALALLRNLRNMEQCGVDFDIIKTALKEANVSKILPFQIIGAARHASPEFADVLQSKLLESIKGYEKLEGDTLFLLDVSASMGGSLSAKSELNRLDACAGVAAIIDGICESSTMYTFNQTLNPISKAYHGMALIDEVIRRRNGGTYLVDCTNKAIENFCDTHNGRFPSRVIVITDEADNMYQHYGWTAPNKPLMNLPNSCKGYMINVAPYENGVNYNDSSWTRINGWSEGVIKYITEYEKLGKRK